MASKNDNTSITEIGDDETPVEIKKTAPKITVPDDTNSMSGETMLVTIHQGEGELGSHAVFLAINGHGLLIPRGVESEIPVEALEVLENAVMTKYEEIGGKWVERQVQRYSYVAKPKRKK